MWSNICFSINLPLQVFAKEYYPYYSMFKYKKMHIYMVYMVTYKVKKQEALHLPSSVS